ncbi:MAG: 4-hydroxythreonine-4-phosphate dehydrogenase PdxA [Bacteroidales bacterium]|nr:4-hydroxythreonine-4-phosphate dehydrogenase PdxA [Bacteroidales bacterium]MDD3201861.1 4-hydroxythreonine-4-phosphate dehydrogenase PdxA [Bacteroidales bacterium]
MGQKIVLGITQGDSNGIGYEVIIKALSDARLLEMCVPIVYGSSRTFGMVKKLIPETEQMNTNIVNSARDAHSKRVNIINAVPDSLAVELGQPTVDGAKAAIIALKAAVADLKDGAIDAIVTAPFNKHTVACTEFSFPGHTEYLISEFGAKDGLMFLCSDDLKVGVVTNHLPLSQVSASITKDVIVSKLRLMNASLMRDFGCVRPKIAVLGLNPHAGDAGSLGREEIDVIIPAIEEANKENILAFGTYSPDGFFSTNMQYKFDAVLAMYHDQGLIPFKALAFDKGVNFTAGLPVVRTSPDHGTAFELAGKGIANPMPMISSIYTAIDICNNRAKYDEMTNNPLEIKHFEGPKYERTILPE